MITGNQEYTIDYTLRNVVTFYNDHDELYWDINGDQWNQTFDNVRLTLHLPSDLRLGNQAPRCYTGTFGSQLHNCFIEQPRQQLLISQTTAALTARQTLTILVSFQKGYFHSSTWYETVGEYQSAIIAFVIPFFLTAGAAGWFWFRLGRDPKGRGVIVPEYDAPDNLSAIEIGTLIDFKTDNKDITATIIDLAIRGYLTIIEQKKNRTLRRDTTVYTLRLKNNDYSKLNPFEATIMKGLFSDSAKDQEIDLSAMRYRLSTTASKLRITLRASLTDRGYFRPNRFTIKRIVIGLSIIAALFVATELTNTFGSPVGWRVGMAVGGGIAFLFVMKLGSRTEKGVAAIEHSKGLKMYLQVAEAERIKKLQSPNAPYAANAKEPSHTVELFEKLLPYAMVLGVEQEWAKQFEHIYQSPPDWYSGNWNSFSLIYFTANLTSGIGSQVNTAFSQPSSASGSGFGGGGGAGGGGGGGGGGGW